MKKKLDHLVEKRREKVNKQIDNNNITWIRKAFLRLIYIEQKYMIRWKSVKRNNDKKPPIFIYGQRSRAKIVIPKHDMTVSNQQAKSPKNLVINK